MKPARLCLCENPTTDGALCVDCERPVSLPTWAVLRAELILRPGTAGKVAEP